MLTPVDKLLRNLSTHKTTDSDDIPAPYLLNLTAHKEAEALRLIFQVSVQQGIIPTDWKNVHIVPAFKKRDWNYSYQDSAAAAWWI